MFALTDTGAAGHLLAYLARRADNAGARAWDSVMRDTIHAGKSGTARAWFTARDGQDVHTLQATVTASGDTYSVWTPGERTVDAVRPSSVRLGGSTRDYAGLRVVAATADTLIAVSAWGEDAMQVCVYTTEIVLAAVAS